METGVIHARFRTSDFDEGSGPGFFDNDAQDGTLRAYRAVIRHLRKLAETNKGPNWKEVKNIIRPELSRIAHNYWRDYDYDERMNSAKVKAEAAKLLHPLKTAHAALGERPFYVRRALNSEASFALERSSSEHKDLYATALAANQALIEACEVFIKRDHRKKGGAIRFQNACRDLAALWTQIFGKKFPRNSKTGQATDREIARGVSRVFTSPGAAFVYLTLCEIGKGSQWVTVSQVGEAIDAMKGGK